MTPGHQKQRLTMASHLPTDVFPDTRASSHTVVVPETSTAIGSCCRCGLPPSCPLHCMAIALHVDDACDAPNPTSTIPPPCCVWRATGVSTSALRTCSGSFTLHWKRLP